MILLLEGLPFLENILDWIYAEVFNDTDLVTALIQEGLALVFTILSHLCCEGTHLIPLKMLCMPLFHDLNRPIRQLVLLRQELCVLRQIFLCRKLLQRFFLHLLASRLLIEG